MTQQIFDFEGTDGAALPNPGTNYTLVGSGGVAEYRATAAAVGSTGAHFETAAGQPKVARCVLLTPSKTVAWSPVLKTPPSRPPTGVRYSIGTLRHASGVALRLEYDEFGQIGIEGVSGGFFGVSATNFPVSTKFRAQLEIVVGTTTTPSAGNSTLTAKVYSGAGYSTLNGTGIVGKTNLDAGTANIAASDVGCVTAGMPEVEVDYVMFEDGRTTEFGALPSASSPSANAGADHYQKYGTVTLDGSGTTGEAAGVTYLWECISKPEYAPSPSIANPAAESTTAVTVDGVYVWRLTVTNPGATPSTDTVTSWLYPDSNDNVKIRAVTRGAGVTNEGGATETVAVNDTSATTKHRWPDNPSGQTDILTMNPYGPGPIGFKESGYWTTPDTGGAIQRTVAWQKEDGSSLQAADTPRVLPGGVNATEAVATEVNHPLSDANLAVLGAVQADRRALRVVVADALV